MAWGHKLQGKTDTAVLCHLGDGATSEGDFHEGLNFAGVFDVPAVFVCNNNQWAISVPRERQTASETIAEKAQAYGIDGVRVDGLARWRSRRTGRRKLPESRVAESAVHATELSSTLRRKRPRMTRLFTETIRVGGLAGP